MRLAVTTLVAVLFAFDAAARTSDAYRVTVGEGDAARALPVHLALTPDGAGNWFKLPPEVFRVYDGIDHATVGKQTFFTSFDSDAAETKVTVRPARPFKAFRIKPAAYGIPAERRGDELVLSVPKGRKIVVELDGDTSGQLSIFSNAPAGAPTEAKRTIRFAPGLHTAANDARIRPDEYGNPVLQGLADDTVVSLDEGAVVEAAVVIAGLKNVRIEGRGMFSLLERCEGADRGFRGKLWGGFRRWALPSVYIRSGSRGVTIDGVTFVSEFRGIVARNSDDIVIRNVKNFTYTANGDGINCVNCSNVLVDDCYLRNGDDNVCMYTSYDSIPTLNDVGYAPHAPVSENYEIKNCVLWVNCRPFQIAGHGTGSSEPHDRVANIRVHDCEIVDVAFNVFGNTRKHDEFWSGALRILSQGEARVSDVRFERINVDLTAGYTGKPIHVETRDSGKRSYSEKRGYRIENVVFKDVAFSHVATNAVPSFLIGGHDADSGDDYGIFGVTFDNVTLDGRPLTPDDLTVRRRVRQVKWELPTGKDAPPGNRHAAGEERMKTGCRRTGTEVGMTCQ